MFSVVAISHPHLINLILTKTTSFPAPTLRPQGPFLPNYAPVEADPSRQQSYGIVRLDHAVGNVHNLMEAVRYIAGFTGGRGGGTVHV